MSEILFREPPKTNNNNNNDKLESTIALLREENAKNVHYNVLCDAVKEAKLDPELAAKIRALFLATETAQCLSLPDNCTLLGLGPIQQEISFAYVEKVAVREALEASLKTKLRKIKAAVADVTSKIASDGGGGTQQELFDCSAKLEHQLTTYVANLGTLTEALETLIAFRNRTIPRLYEKKIAEAEARTRVNERKARIITEKARIDIFTENKCAFGAYAEIRKDIESQQEECRREIKHMQQLKCKYDAVACKEYDAILKSYIHYKNSLARLRKVYEKVN